MLCGSWLWLLWSDSSNEREDDSIMATFTANKAQKDIARAERLSDSMIHALLWYRPERGELSGHERTAEALKARGIVRESAARYYLTAKGKEIKARLESAKDESQSGYFPRSASDVSRLRVMRDASFNHRRQPSASRMARASALWHRLEARAASAASRDESDRLYSLRARASFVFASNMPDEHERDARRTFQNAITSRGEAARLASHIADLEAINKPCSDVLVCSGLAVWSDSRRSRIRLSDNGRALLATFRAARAWRLVNPSMRAPLSVFALAARKPVSNGFDFAALLTMASRSRGSSVSAGFSMSEHNGEAEHVFTFALADGSPREILAVSRLTADSSKLLRGLARSFARRA
jgi:hypothetical protein